jgi:aspartyl/asparaginyl-tRNA synthetase
MVFFNLRQRTDTVQGLLLAKAGMVSKQMVKWAAGLADESIVLVEGVVNKAPEPIKSATVDNVEVHIIQVNEQCYANIAILPLSSAASCLGYRRSTSVFHRGCIKTRHVGR